MSNILFVCYQHGCKGEGLSVKISKHDTFKTLNANVVNNRTVILDEYFNKKFLCSWPQNFSDLKNNSKENIVVPSHLFFESLKTDYGDQKFVSIDAPKDIDKFRQELYDRYYCYSTNNIAELAGECENRYREYHPDASKTEVASFTVKCLKKKKITFGEIHCMAKGVDISETNIKRLIANHVPQTLSKETIKNSFVVPYEDVKKINIEDIVEYFKYKK